MKKSLIYLFTLCITLISANCLAQKTNLSAPIKPYSPVDQEIHDSIVAMDKKFFDAYNNCDMEMQRTIYADSIEFFHDKTGLSTDKKGILESTEKNICGKVTRTLVEGSLEVYPINHYGAVQIGYHKFFNNQEPDQKSIPSKFIIIWKKEAEDWRIAKVVSLH